MTTSSFTRKIVITGKEAVDMIIDGLVSDTPEKDLEEVQRRKEKFEKNRKKGRAISTICLSLQEIDFLPQDVVENFILISI